MRSRKAWALLQLGFLRLGPLRLDVAEEVLVADRLVVAEEVLEDRLCACECSPGTPQLRLATVELPLHPTH